MKIYGIPQLVHDAGVLFSSNLNQSGVLYRKDYFDYFS